MRRTKKERSTEEILADCHRRMIIEILDQMDYYKLKNVYSFAKAYLGGGEMMMAIVKKLQQMNFRQLCKVNNHINGLLDGGMKNA